LTTALITGSSGLIGGQAVEFFSDKFDTVIGIDNDMRQVFFGKEASTAWNGERLANKYKNFIAANIDIRDQEAVGKLFKQYGNHIDLILHAAAQPSHDWAAKDPILDFSVNANGTLVLLEMARKYCEDATFIHCSTNKVYGDTPNNLPLVELDKRWEIASDHQYYARGINELMSIDQTKHSVFGASKLAADVMVQEYGKYFGMKTGVFRGGCLTGPNHSGTELHGFLSYLMKCAIEGRQYSIFGYKGKQVRDNIHAYDLLNMFWEFYKNPKKGEVYNAGGSRHSNCSILEAIEKCEIITNKKFNYKYSDENRIGDHIWYISDVSKFEKDYPGWRYKYDLDAILLEIYSELNERIG
jgi:CDP-paratose 2-epimerase